MTIIHPWQQRPWQRVSAYLQAGRFPHALLLAGPKGAGKLLFADVLAKRLLCQGSPGVGGFACGTCRACQLTAVSSHPDFFLVQPETEGGMIKIEQIRTLVEGLAQTGQQGNQQIVVIGPAEAMNRAAANALLKTLEEPSGAVIFLLVSHQPGLLPATVASRCQKLNFPPPPEAPPKLFEGLLQLYAHQLQPTELAAMCANSSDGFLPVFNALWSTVMQLLQSKLAHKPPLMTSDAGLFAAANARVTSFMLFRLIEKLLALKKQVVAEKMNLNMQLMFEELFIECF